MGKRLTTAEIKQLLSACAEDGAVHPIEDFKQYIGRKSDKPFSVGQLSGAIAQLTALGELENVERGVYQKKGGGRRPEGRSEKNPDSEQGIEMRRQLKECLTGAEEKLALIVGSVNVWQISGEELELLREVKRLGEWMEALASRC